MPHGLIEGLFWTPLPYHSTITNGSSNSLNAYDTSPRKQIGSTQLANWWKDSIPVRTTTTTIFSIRLVGSGLTPVKVGKRIPLFTALHYLPSGETSSGRHGNLLYGRTTICRSRCAIAGSAPDRISCALRMPPALGDITSASRRVRGI